MSRNKTQRYSETRRVERTFWTGKPTRIVHVTRRYRLGGVRPGALPSAAGAGKACRNPAYGLLDD